MKKLILTALALGASLPLLAQNFPLEITGDFNGWGNNDGTGPALTDMGGGVYSVTLSGLTANTEYHFKINEGDWNWFKPANPAQGNPDCWFFTDGSGSVTVSIDFNTYNDGWYQQQYRISTSTDPFAWNAVGDFNSWDINTDVMTATGGGIYEYAAIIASPGSYGWKATGTGGWAYQVGADGRNMNPITMDFTTTFANQEVDMFLNANNGTISMTVIPEPATAALFGLREM